MKNEELMNALAEQAYLFHLLVNTLRERGYLRAGEPVSRWNMQDMKQFVTSFLARYEESSSAQRALLK